MRLFLLGLFLILSGNAGAQCFDSTLVQQGYNCPNSTNDYQPLCGCDGVTYNNSCIAEKTGGLVPGSWTDGPCDDFDYYFTPNTVSFVLEYYYYVKTPGILNIFIYDTMGHIKFEYNEQAQLAGFVMSGQAIDVSNLESGIYLMVILKEGNQKVKKFFQGRPF